MKKLFCLLLGLIPFAALAQDTLRQEVKELLSVSEHYKSIRSLKMDISYQFYADTAQKELVDSATQVYFSYNGSTWTKQFNIVSIVGDTFIFHIDHEDKKAWLDTKPEMHEKDLAAGLEEFMQQAVALQRVTLDNRTIKYHLILDGMTYDWTDIYIDLQEKKLLKMVYRLSDKNSSLDETKLIVIGFQNQEYGKKRDKSLFGLTRYISFSQSAEGRLLSPYQQYRFTNYFY